MITEEDYNNWWLSPVGKEVRDMLNERREKIAYGLAEGVATGSQTIYDNSVGRYKEIGDLLDMTYKELMGET